MPVNKLLQLSRYLLIIFISVFLSACSQWGGKDDEQNSPAAQEGAVQQSEAEAEQAKAGDTADGQTNDTEETAATKADAQAARCEIEPQEKHVVEVKKVIHTKLKVIGELEYATIDSNKDLLMKARIDTGAQTTSIGVENIQHFERDGDKWVRFVIKDRDTHERHEFKRPIKRKAKIKQHLENVHSTRSVVQLTITVGDVSRKIDVTLSNRDKFKYPVLIGRNFLDGEMVVDVSSRYLTLDEK